MTIRRKLITPILLWSLVTVAGTALYGQEAAAQATANAVSRSTTTLVPISGVVVGALESVRFQGEAKINSRLAPDPDFNKPRLVLTIDLAGVRGEGYTTRALYVISGPETIQRRLAGWLAVEITFPFTTTSSRVSVAEGTGIANFSLKVDLTTGAVTSTGASVSSPNFGI